MEIVNTKTGDTRFHQIIAEGLEATRTFCLSAGFTPACLEVSNALYQRPLHLAVAARDVELVRFLLESGSSVDAFKKGDWTSLMVASALPVSTEDSKVAQVVVLLLEHGATPRLRNKDGWTAAHLAARSGSLEVLRLLVAAEPELVRETSRSGRGPLHVAALHGHEGVVALLLDQDGVHLSEASDSCGHTPVTEAVIGGHLGTLRLLLERCPDLSSHLQGLRDRCGLGLLHLAARAGHAHLLRPLASLLTRGEQAGIAEGEVARLVSEPAGSEAYTPLHLAVLEKHEAVVAELLDMGASLEVPNKEGRTALQLDRGLDSAILNRLTQEHSRTLLKDS